MRCTFIILIYLTWHTYSGCIHLKCCKTSSVVRRFFFIILCAYISILNWCQCVSSLDSLELCIYIYLFFFIFCKCKRRRRRGTRSISDGGMRFSCASSLRLPVKLVHLFLIDIINYKERNLRKDILGILWWCFNLTRHYKKALAKQNKLYTLNRKKQIKANRCG